MIPSYALFFWALFTFFVDLFLQLGWRWRSEIPAYFAPFPAFFLALFLALYFGRTEEKNRERLEQLADRLPPALPSAPVSRPYGYAVPDDSTLRRIRLSENWKKASRL